MKVETTLVVCDKIVGAGTVLKVGGHNLPAQSAGEIFFTVPPHFWLVPPLVGGHNWARGWAIV